MATIHLKETTTATPEQFVAALTDFGPGRSELFPNSGDDDLKVHDKGPSSADVTEGSSGVWERLHYDWSDPNHVVLTTTDSNTWGGASGHTYTLIRQADGTTDVAVVVVRERFDGLAGSLEMERRTVPFDFDSTDAALAQMEKNGPQVAMKQALGPELYDEAMRRFADLMNEFNQADDGSIRIQSEYLLVVARKRG